MALTGVAGLMLTPTLAPLLRIKSMHSWAFSVASMWNVTRSAPALANRSTYFSGSTIIKCTSINLSVDSVMAFSTGNPNEMLGTNTPSITSMCTHSAALRSIILVSRSKWPKSADSIEGDMIRFLLLIGMQKNLCTKVAKKPKKSITFGLLKQDIPILL